MKAHLDCVPCLLRQAMEAARHATKDENLQMRILKNVLLASTKIDLHLPPPFLAQEFHRIIRRTSGKTDPYRIAKDRLTALAMNMLPDLETDVREAQDQLSAATRMAIAGNIIDLGANGDLDASSIWNAVLHARIAPLHGDPLELHRTADAANSILYLADNAAELVFDRLLIESLGPERTTVVVRGSPVLDDATMTDARAVGLIGWVDVIDNGSDAPGTILADCHGSFRRRFERADMVIAKGQGNWESLSGVQREIFFLLKAKCPVIAQDLGCRMGSLVLKKSAPSESVDGEEPMRPAC